MNCNKSTFQAIGVISGLVWIVSFALIIASALCCLKDPNDTT
jgi:hypothetical protein